MTPVQVETIIAVATFLCSVGVSSFIAGLHWGQIRADVQTMKEQLAEIRGMFVLRIRDGNASDK